MENTPIEEEIALDPELLGKVFENLLVAYNSETRLTARKQTGSFYTPREVVNYMVNESLLVYLATQVMAAELVDEADRADLEQRLRQLLDYKSDRQPFEPQEVVILIRAIDQLKSLDPAVGSGAFPMGLLQKLVFILGKLDPNNEQWKYQQKEREILPLLEDIRQAKQINSAQDKLMLEYFEQIINGLVYELYLPEDLHAHNFTFASHLESEKLPALDSIKGDKLAALRTVFQHLYAQNHPIRQNLFALDTLPVIRLIEAKA